jgi:Domain of unknown function (DUF3859)
MQPYHKITWLVLLTVACSATAGAEDLKGRIVGGGTYTVTENYKLLKTFEPTPGSSRLYVDPPTFTAVTDRIPAKMGVRFGIVFELTNLPKTQYATVGIVLVTKHPLVRRPDGTTSTGTEQRVRMEVRGQDRIVSWTGVGFDHAEELVPGIWTFEVRSYSRLLCKKDFTVVRN